MNEGLPKYGSVDLKRRVNSHNKLPRLASIEVNNHKLKESTTTGKNDTGIKLSMMGQKRTRSNEKVKNLLKLKLDPIPIKTEQITKIKQCNNKGNVEQNLNIRQSHKIERKYSPVKNSDIGIRQSMKGLKKQDKQQSEIDIVLSDENQKKKSLDDRSSVSSREAMHPVMKVLSSMLSYDSRDELIIAKMNSQKNIGEVSSLWWCVTDSLILSMQKLIKVKKNIIKDHKDHKDKDQRKLSPQRIRDSEQCRQEMKQDKIAPKIKGKSLTNIKPTIEFAKSYCHLEEEIANNEKGLLKYYEDPNHISLIVEGLFFEKVTIYLIGSIRKWNHPEEQLYIHSFASEVLPIILQIRKLMIDILVEAVDNAEDTKMKKPKYIAREKKLIQISKFTSIMKFQLEKTLQNLGSSHRYKIFQHSSLKQHRELCKLQCKWRNKIFDMPLSPFISKELVKKKQYLLIIQPLGILYKYNKKQELLLVDPYAQYFLSEVSKYFEILFFTHTQKEVSLLNFMGVLQRLELMGILDKPYLSFKGGKAIKDIKKIGTPYNQNKILILDDKNNKKYYSPQAESLYLVDGNHSHMKICRVKGKLVKKQEEDEEFLQTIMKNIIKCAQKGGNWNELKSS